MGAPKVKGPPLFSRAAWLFAGACLLGGCAAGVAFFAIAHSRQRNQASPPAAFAKRLACHSAACFMRGAHSPAAYAAAISAGVSRWMK
jgi:hypothetical protein